MIPSSFDPAVRAWFADTFGQPTACQARAWAALAQGDHTLVAAPTGSGKTLAAFLTALSDLAAEARDGTLVNETRVLYVSPLKALSNDIQRNLEQPLAGIRARLEAELGMAPGISTAVRTGDTPAAARTLMRKRPPHILVTTPESLYILLTSDSGREMLRTVRSVIVDEIHAVVANKRGAHLALSLARLERLTPTPPVRIGLSATQRPIERVAEFLVGIAGRPCTIIDEGHVRRRDLAIEMPPSPLETVLSAEVAEELRARMVELITAHRTTLVFVNTRRMAERLARALAEQLGDDQVCSHHGSMSRERRFDAEKRLKAGELKVLVATASLELGIDIGDVDLVCQLGATRTLAMFLQRVGRSGHAVGGTAKGRLFPQTRDELVECITLLDMVRRDELDSVEIPPGPLDVLAQQLVAEVASGDYEQDALFALAREAWPYRNLSREDFRAVVEMLAAGYAFARGRQSGYLHLDDVNGRLSARRGARLVAVTCGGAIPDTADYDVIAEPGGEIVGSVNEDFAIESLPGNVFQLGNTSWRVLRVEASALRVEDAAGEPPNMPFWLGEAPARSTEFSAAVSRLRTHLRELAERPGTESAELAAWLGDIPGVGAVAARQAAEYLLAGYRALGAMPTQDTLVMERFFDESGGMQLVIHSPFGSRLNKAWGLALRKRFCRTFNFELQAAAIEDAIVISLGAVHSFELDEVWRYLTRDSVRDVLTQALLTAPLFTIRWRWVASCALAIQRFRGGRKTPPRLMRMQAEDLVAVVFPDQLACAENLSGRRDIPDHPLVRQAIEDCLHEAMDVSALEALLGEIAAGHKTLVTRDLTEPSPFALAVLNANPYAFLDDAPLEERRTQAVSGRRWLDPATADDLGRLDAAAIARVREEVWPRPRDADEMHEAVLLLGFVPEEEAARLGEGAAVLCQGLHDGGRLVHVAAPLPGWLATERQGDWLGLHPDSVIERRGAALGYDPGAAPERDEALAGLARSRLEMSGPLGAAELGAILAVSTAAAVTALTALERRGIALRGRFDNDAPDAQWCDRRLLARIHRYTLGRLRQEIEPVPGAVFMRFLADWQHLTVNTRLQGSGGLLEVLGQLSGFEAPAAAWEGQLLPNRLRAYQLNLLDELVRAGRAAWLRLTPKRTLAARQSGTLRNTPLALMPRADLALWLECVEFEDEARPGGAAASVLAFIERGGAAFFDDIVAGCGLLRTQCENALDELAAAGHVTCDSFAGLRALTLPAARRQAFGRRTRRTTLPGIDEAGRWDRLRRDAATSPSDTRAEAVARILLRRYGVVFRALLERETALPPWRELLWALRRLEDRGEVRGGRFVAGHSGEQFALPDAVGALREIRRREGQGQIVAVSAADPLNLVGVVLPGARIPAVEQNQLAFLDGVPAGYRLGSEFQLAESLPHDQALRVRTALLGQPAERLAPPRRRWR
ncbi:MAG: DEAD/DEAH box helicase [Gammaproteobacteria bacterium]|nr:DEAD/DEAH box helicase [Gammaproteobacteria bacterium]